MAGPVASGRSRNAYPARASVHFAARRHSAADPVAVKDRKGRRHARGAAPPLPAAKTAEVPACPKTAAADAYSARHAADRRISRPDTGPAHGRAAYGPSRACTAPVDAPAGSSGEPANCYAGADPASQTAADPYSPEGLTLDRAAVALAVCVAASCAGACAVSVSSTLDSASERTATICGESRRAATNGPVQSATGTRAAQACETVQQPDR